MNIIVFLVNLLSEKKLSVVLILHIFDDQGSWIFVVFFCICVYVWFYVLL